MPSFNIFTSYYHDPAQQKPEISGINFDSLLNKYEPTSDTDPEGIVASDNDSMPLNYQGIEYLHSKFITVTRFDTKSKKKIEVKLDTPSVKSCNLYKTFYDGVVLIEGNKGAFDYFNDILYGEGYDLHNTWQGKEFRIDDLISFVKKNYQNSAIKCYTVSDYEMANGERYLNLLISKGTLEVMSPTEDEWDEVVEHGEAIAKVKLKTPFFDDEGKASNVSFSIDKDLKISCKYADVTNVLGLLNKFFQEV